jgi:hypothetical protein
LIAAGCGDETVPRTDGPAQRLEARPGGDGRRDRTGSADRRATDKPRTDGPQTKVDGPSLCATSESEFNKHCYLVTGIKYIGYSTAKTLCATQNPPSQMVAITSAAENAFVYGLLPPLNQVAWIGMKRTGTGATDFAWETGEAVSYWNWASGEPNNETGSENCVVMWGPHLSNTSFRSHWNDMPCDYASVDAVICERVP